VTFLDAHQLALKYFPNQIMVKMPSSIKQAIRSEAAANYSDRRII